MHHSAAPASEMCDLGKLGKCSVTVMLRTALFPFHRSRVRNTTPSPVEFFQGLSKVFVKDLAGAGWVLPTLAQCLAEEAPDVGAPAAPPMKKSKRS